MKMTNVKVLSCIAFLPIVTLSLVSCGEKKGDDSSDSTEEASSSAVESKFNNLGTDLKSVITADQVKDLLGLEAEIKTKSLDHKSYGNVAHRWPSDRKQMIKMGTSEMETKVDNMVRVMIPTTIKLYGMADALSAFNHQYKEMTPEEMEKALKMMADIKARRDKEAGKTPSETEKKVGKSVMSGIAGAAAKTEYEPVSGLGDAAKWEKSGKNLIILDGDKILKIQCDVSADNAECRDAAVKVAKHIYSNL